MIPLSSVPEFNTRGDLGFVEAEHRCPGVSFAAVPVRRQQDPGSRCFSPRCLTARSESHTLAVNARFSLVSHSPALLGLRCWPCSGTPVCLVLSWGPVLSPSCPKLSSSPLYIHPESSFQNHCPGLPRFFAYLLGALSSFRCLDSLKSTCSVGPSQCLLRSLHGSGPFLSPVRSPNWSTWGGSSRSSHRPNPSGVLLLIPLPLVPLQVPIQLASLIPMPSPILGSPCSPVVFLGPLLILLSPSLSASLLSPAVLLRVHSLLRRLCPHPGPLPHPRSFSGSPPHSPSRSFPVLPGPPKH